MGTTGRPTAEELLAQARWVRRLARNLTADEAQAEDLVQTTWLAALQHAPERLGSLRAWLARVMRNAAHHEGRRRALRLEREPKAARTEALPSTEHLAERAELQRLLVGAVLSLEEPYRSTLLWLYFDDLSAEEIARKLRVPASTVRNRHQRALELLRGVLERHEGADWRVGCSALGLKTIGGGLLMGAKMKLVLCALVAVVGSVVFWNEVGARVEPDARPSALAEALAPAAIVAPSTPEPASDERRAVVAAHEGTFLVFGSVRAADGSVPAGVRVFAQDAWGERSGAVVESSGSYSLAGLHAGAWTLDLRGSPGWYAASRELELRMEPIVRVDFELLRAPSIAILLQTTAGENAESLFRDDVWHGAYVPRFEVLATSEPLQSPIDEAQLLRTRCGTYATANDVSARRKGQVPEGYSGLLELDRPAPAFASVALRGRVLARAQIRADTRELTFQLDPGSVLAELGGLHFRLLDARSGEPLASAATKLFELSVGEWGNPVFMDLAQGNFDRQRLPAGDYELQIRVPGFEHLVRAVRIEPRRTTDLGDILLAEGCLVRGRVVDENGKGLAVRLAWSRLDARGCPNLIEQEGSQADGSFALAELPREGVRLFVLDAEWAIDPRTCLAQPGVSPQIELVAHRGTELLLRQQLAESEPLEWLLSRADGVALWGARDLRATTHRLRLVPGTYTLAVTVGGKPLETRTLVIAGEAQGVDLAR